MSILRESQFLMLELIYKDASAIHIAQNSNKVVQIAIKH